MKCGVHPEKEAVGTCVQCGIAFCDECKVVVNDKNVCKKCVDKVITSNKTSERNPVVAAVLSFFFPGVGQVYNGQIGKAAFVFFTWWLFIPWIYGIIDAYLTAQKISSGQLVTKPTSFGCLIVIIVFFVVAIPGCALVTAIAVPNLMRAKMAANDALAKATLRSLSVASESYAADNKGRYPMSSLLLTAANPPYMIEDYCGQTMSGFTYECKMTEAGYQFIATPSEPGASGFESYSIITGGIMTP